MTVPSLRGDTIPIVLSQTVPKCHRGENRGNSHSPHRDALVRAPGANLVTPGRFTDSTRMLTVFPPAVEYRRPITRHSAIHPRECPLGRRRIGRPRGAGEFDGTGLLPDSFVSRCTRLCGKTASQVIDR